MRTLLLLLALLPLLTHAQQINETVAEDAGRESADTTVVVSKARSKEYTERHKLIYEDYSDLPPYSFIDANGKATGYNVELVRELLTGLGIPFEIDLKHIGDAYRDLKNGSADLILSIKAKKREDCGIYGRVPICMFTTSLLTPKSKPLRDVKRVRELGDNKVLVHTGSLAYDVMVERGMKDNAHPVSDMSQAIQTIHKQDSGMVVWNTMALKYLINTWNYTNLQLSPINDLHSDLRFISHDTILLAKLDSAYLVRQSDPVLLDLRRHWFYPETEEHDNSTLLQVAGVLVFLALVATMVYFWLKRDEREYARSLVQKSVQLSLYLKTGGITMWTYDIARKRFAELSGMGEEQTAQDTATFGSRYNESDFGSILLALEQIAAGEKKKHQATVRQMGDDGQYQYYELLMSVLDRDSHGRPRTVLGLQSNVTAERQKHLELRESALKFRTAFNVSTAWLLCFGRNGWLTDINQTACNEFGISDPQGLINEGYTMEGLPFDLSGTGAMEGREVWVSAQTDFDQRRAQGRLSRYITARGQVFHELIIVPVTSSKGEHLATYVAGLNITDSVETARESRERAKEIEYIYEKSRQGMENLSHSLSFAQIRMGQYLPQRRSLTFGDEGFGHDISPLNLMRFMTMNDRRKVARYMERMDERVMENYSFKCGTRLRCDDGNGFRVFFVSILPVEGDDHLADHYIVLTRDISTMERLQEQLEQEAAKAKEAEQIKNAFLRNMSAEIRRPLSNMLDSANSLSRLPANPEGDNSEASRLSDNIHHTCRNLLALVGDILTLSKIEAGMEESCIETIDMAVLFPAICQMSAGGADCEKLKVKVEGAYDSLNIDTDTNFLTRIIEGLFRCALKTTTEGYIRASYEYFNGNLVLRIEDTGAGLTRDQIAAIGDHRFSGEDHQYDLSIKLAIVQELAHRLSGRMDIESAPGHGTTVWVTLPCVLHDFKLHTANDHETA